MTIWSTVDSAQGHVILHLQGITICHGHSIMSIQLLSCRE